jgi:hypothetical protein
MIMERSTTVEIGGEEYELILTTAATKEIAKRYGGIDKLDSIMSTDDYIQSMEEASFLIVLLANQGVRRENLKGGNRKELTEEIFELLTEPSQFDKFGEAIKVAIERGAKRNVPDGETGTKNTKAG